MKLLPLLLTQLLLTFNAWSNDPNIALNKTSNSHGIDPSFEITSESKITANNIESFDWFGGAVSLYEGHALISADNADGRGYAYVFEYDQSTGNWFEEQRLRPLLNGDFLDDFGNSVSLHGNRAVIGSPGDNEGATDAGGAYIFEYDSNKNTWDELPRLYASDREAGDFFGWAVNIHQDRIIVGARFDDEGDFSDLGSAYIFDYDSAKDQWVETVKLLPSDQEDDLLFGEAVSINDNWAFVGANFDSTNGDKAGVVYVYAYDQQLNQWQEKQKLYPRDPRSNAWFGSSISLDGNRVLIGATFDYDYGVNKGAAYVFEYDNSQQLWIETQKLTSNDGVSNDAFGNTVSLYDDRALIGAFRDDDNGEASGSAYLFKLRSKTWIETEKITASDAAADAYFGRAVAVNNEYLVVGAEQDDEVDVEAGAAYIYSTDIIFKTGLDEKIIDCSLVTYPPGITSTSGLYRNYNDNFNFGETTSSTFLANISTSEYLSLSDFFYPEQDSRRRINFFQAPTSHNLMDQGTLSISECPGDFTETANCVIQINNQKSFYVTTKDSDPDSDPFCKIDPNKTYYYNLILSPQPFTVAPTCNQLSDSECAVFSAEAL